VSSGPYGAVYDAAGVYDGGLVVMACHGCAALTARVVEERAEEQRDAA
jgi:hypothetical protein